MIIIEYLNFIDILFVFLRIIIKLPFINLDYIKLLFNFRIKINRTNSQKCMKNFNNKNIINKRDKFKEHKKKRSRQKVKKQDTRASLRGKFI